MYTVHKSRLDLCKYDQGSIKTIIIIIIIIIIIKILQNNDSHIES